MHDVAVIGAGITGLFAAAAAMDRGWDVVCLEAGEVAGLQSRGEGRIFRVAHARPELCAQALRAADRWLRCEQVAGEALLDRCGLAVIGEDAAERHDAMHRAGAAAQLSTLGRMRARVPQVEGDSTTPLLWDPAGASIRTGAVTRWLQGLLGDRVRTASPVGAVERESAAWSMETPDGRVSARVVVVCAGTSTADVAARFGIGLPGGLGARRTLRLTFAPTGGEVPCIIDRRGPDSYSLPTARGYSVGLTDETFEPRVEDEDEPAFVARGAEACHRYARERMIGVETPIFEQVACEFPTTPLLADGEGWRILGDGPVRVLVTANAYKFAPLIGEELVAELPVRRML